MDKDLWFLLMGISIGFSIRAFFEVHNWGRNLIFIGFNGIYTLFLIAIFFIYGFK